MSPSPSDLPPRKTLPIETRLTLGFRQHLGPRFRSAELTIEAIAHHDGIMVSCEDQRFEQSEYFTAAVRGVVNALTRLGITDTRIHIVRAMSDDIASSPHAFEACAFQAVNALNGIRSS